MDLLKQLDPLRWHAPQGFAICVASLISLAVGVVCGSSAIVAVGAVLAAAWALAAVACGVYGAYEGAREGWRAGASPWTKPFTAFFGALGLAGILACYGMAGGYSEVIHYDFTDAPSVIGAALPKTTTAPAIAKQPSAPLRDLPLTSTTGSGEPLEAAPPRAPSATPGILSKLPGG
jgi:hypothetical protein